ncbi:MAG: hypothetical protein IPL63_08620 [Saprospiraceae bacterium]|nr:hypothetical protein [Saprospiraceae bacterium]MBK6564201.1 hypothetical protein [Saprospiraceae bacterium]MBK6782363.1 hypothetical protein [Saprospiraceae bacterium]MBK7524119.1 hypothetical protein [Saprospiraceae bacterium]MBK8078902.1 hypothetical protein [Saprospiraceae bacterium]
MRNKILGILFWGMFCFTPIVNAQTSKISSGVPRVFLIGEEEKKYEQIMQQYSQMLFQVCDNSMDDAYNYWNTMMRDMENFAKTQNVDLKGIKIWLNVFWNTDGSIDYIVYHPKPNSKNMNYQELTKFFIAFQSQYQLPLKSVKKFSHYGSASFPLFNKAHLVQEK